MRFQTINRFEVLEDKPTDLLSTKVDKVPGKGLSTRNFTNNDWLKLNSIPADAEANVNAD